ncbi:MAG: PKD domain-containing protein [Bacteroidota bacterium]
MSLFLRQTILFATFVLLEACVFGGIDPRLVENKGQWDSRVHFKALTNGGYFYIDDQGITVQQLEEGFFENFHNFIQGDTAIVKGDSHVLKLKFVGGNLDDYIGEDNLNRSENFFLGNDTLKHARNVKSFKRASYQNVYSNIDLIYDIRDDRLKYEFHVAPGAEPEQIEIQIDHANSIRIEDDVLIFETSVGQVYDGVPFVYQINQFGGIERVVAHYELNDNRVSFSFPHGYDETRELIIDPEISFSTYIGAFSDNFGFTASYDNEGHLYAGAIVFGQDYPVEGGPFQTTFNGGNVDCAITKFSPDGSQLIYSTFLGGAANETPHSLVVNDNGEVFAFGTTSSFDFPTTSTAFMPAFTGGPFLTSVLGFSFINGTDIFVSKISSDGGDLLGSTFIGGSGNDGVGLTNDMYFNYGDTFRGEIVLDPQGQVYVATVTGSADFPFINGFSGVFNGFSNGVVFSLDSDLEQLNWSSSTGGQITDAAYGLQISPDGTIYLTGGTTSPNLIGADNGFDGNYSGSVDGFLMRISADGSTVLSSTYIGSPSFDQTYFVQLDQEGEVYVIGQSLGDIEVSDGVYSNPNGRQFVQKYNAELNDREWSTRIGSDDGQIDFSPSAFLITNCNDIYISGWGGTTNSAAGAQAGGNTFGLPTTNDAFQTDTDGSDFYLMVLSEDAEDLTYATFFGGSQSAEHVDGGTSRFDKNGTVYQAVCAGCTGQDDFPTQTGVWSQTNLSSNCNLGVFKFRLNSVSASAEVNFETPIICAGQEVEFTNLSQDANAYIWDFGDETTSTEVNPTHIFAEPGNYEITLLAEDSQGCLGPDSTSVELEVLPGPDLAFDFDNVPICEGSQLTLGATGADTYTWEPTDLFLDNEIAFPIFIGNSSATVTLIGSSTCGQQSLQTEILVSSVNVQLEDEFTICPGESIQLSVTGGESFEWVPDAFLDDPNIANPTTTPTTDITYEVTVFNEIGCEGTGTVTIDLSDPPPVLVGETDYVTCNSIPVQMQVSGGDNYAWFPTNGLNNSNIANPMANPSEDITYTVTSFNDCGEGSLEIFVGTQAIDISLEVEDTIACFLSPIGLSASGATSYQWSPASIFADPSTPSTTAELITTTEITVIGFNDEGCFDTERRTLRVFPREPIFIGLDEIISFGSETTIEAFSLFDIQWESSEYLSCFDCFNPVASPPETTTFYATIETDEGCIERDSITVTVTGNIYVPNSFTPDGDGINDIFKAEGVDIAEFKMEIWNLWGELVFTSNSIDNGWNGSSPNGEFFTRPDLYAYRIVATEHTGELFELEGMVTLIR